MDTKTYSLCEVPVRLEVCSPQQAAHIQALWRQLFILREEEISRQAPAVVLHFKPAAYFQGRSPMGQVVFETPGLRMFKTASDFCLRCGESILDLDLSGSRGVGVLAEDFWRHSQRDQRGFFLLTFLMLFPQHGRYGLHANAVVKEDAGCLIVGNSGYGKTTLTLSLVREGWHYLSDDALVLQCTPAGIEANAFRRWFACTQETAGYFPELRDALGETLSLEEGKRAVNIKSLYPGQFTTRCKPRLILFSQITDHSSSQLLPLDATQTMTALMRQSPGTMVGRPVVNRQLDVLKRLVHQVRSYQFLLGADVYQEPAIVSELLWSVLRG